MVFRWWVRLVVVWKGVGEVLRKLIRFWLSFVCIVVLDGNLCSLLYCLMGFRLLVVGLVRKSGSWLLYGKMGYWKLVGGVLVGWDVVGKV